MPPARVIADYVVGLDIRTIPPEVMHESRRVLLNFIGCALGGTTHDVTRAVARALRPYQGERIASLIGLGRRADPLTAAHVNGASASSHSFDDTHGEAIVHAGAPVASAALALGQSLNADGSSFLLALFAGFEIACRLSKAISVPPAAGNIAWYQTGITCGAGAAVAAGRLLGLTADQLVHAIGHAIGQASGTRVMQGSMTMLMLAGHAAQCGIKAALFAREGVTSPENSIDGPYGFFEMFARESHAPWLSGHLGQRFEILSNTYKSYPCGVVLHPVVDATRELKSAFGSLGLTDIESVDVEVHPSAIVLTDRLNPLSRTEGQVSLQHWTVIGLISPSVSLREGTLEMIRNPAIVAARARVRVFGKEELARDAARVTLRMKSGRTETSRLYRGCAPMSDRQLEDKLKLQAQDLPSFDTQRAIDAVWSLGENVNIETLGKVL
jgi:2-methylcitrate dehydratase PrpD